MMKTRSRKSNNKTRKLRKLPKNVIHGGLLGHEKKDFIKELELLKEQCKTTAGRQDLLEENLAFVATITAAIAIKNKLDFPPAGPFTDDKVKYQDARIRYILQGISEYNMNEINDRKRYILGAWGAAHQTAMNVNALASKSLRTGKALADWNTKKKEYKDNTATRSLQTPFPPPPPFQHHVSPRITPTGQTPLPTPPSLEPHVSPSIPPSLQPRLKPDFDFEKDGQKTYKQINQQINQKKSWFGK
uniref:Uncharacterized protein n=1 Tax=viral metagenome TaxID=1070528 RepID=A0A6C0H2C3_9ZZZZ